MSSSVPLRRVAANRLWTPEGVLRNPLVEWGADGRIRRITTCGEPDRLAGTEFYAGLLVVEFPADFRTAFARLQAQPEVPLTEALPRLAEEMEKGREGAPGAERPAAETAGAEEEPAEWITPAARRSEKRPKGQSVKESSKRMAMKAEGSEPADGPRTVPVVISGLDYTTLRLTPRARIMKL